MFESVDILKRDLTYTEGDLSEEILKLKKTVSELSTENQLLKNQIYEFSLFPPQLSWVLYLCRNEKTLEILNIEGDVDGIFGCESKNLINKEIHIDDFLRYEKESRYDLIQQNLTKDNHYQILYRILGKNGRIKWVLEFGKVLESDTTKLDGCILDVTFQFSRQKKKDVSKDVYKILIDQIPIHIFFKNKNSEYMTCNKSFAELFQIKKEDITGKTDFDLYPHDLALQYQKEDREILESGNSFETIDSYKEGKNIRYVQRLKYPIIDKRSKRNGIAGISWDITSSKIQSGKLQTPKSIFFDSDVNFMIGLYGNQNYVSPSIKNITGYTTHEIFKKKWVELFTEGSFQIVKNAYNDYLKHAEKLGGTITHPSKYLHNYELEIIRKDGGTIWVKVLTNFLSNEKNEIIGIIGSLKDISFLKRIEQLNAESLYKEIQINQLKSKFISTITHDLRTPLAVINANLKMLEDQSFDLGNEMQKDAFKMSFDAINTISRNFEQIEIYKRTENNLISFQPESISLNNFFRLLIKEINVADQSDRIELVDKFPDKLLKMDKHLMFHIFSNLINNALKYSEKSTKIYININDLGKHVEFIIQDKGIGIPRKEIPLVFESFYRASNIGDVKGTGLGLSTVKNCVDIHEGKIKIQSKKDTSTTITVILPYGHARN